jgi:hypothetical protein
MCISGKRRLRGKPRKEGKKSMRRSAILLPALLLPALLTLPAWAQTWEESQRPQNSGCGIEPDKLYPGSILLELIRTAEEEIDNAVTEAYAEGYKAASLRHAPEAEYYKLASEALSKELEGISAKMKRDVWRNRILSGAVGFAAGIIGFGIYHLTTQ